jgi:DNA-directed RNA polymerase specialized sigma24 family protein
MSNARIEKLYGKFGPAIYARCKRLLRDGAAAEDATQDVFMKVLKHLDTAFPKGTSDDAVLPWIHRIRCPARASRSPARSTSSRAR